MPHRADSNPATVLDRLRAAEDLLDLHTLSIGNRCWQIAAVRNQSALIELAPEDGVFPFGYVLWESALALAERLAGEPQRVAGKRVLELGAGVGLPGLVARNCGAEVWLTDHDASVLQIARDNARRNGVGEIHAIAADWRNWTIDQQYDVILGADIVYESAAWDALEHIFRRNLAPAGHILLSDPGRVHTLQWLGALEQRGWSIDLSIVPVRETLATATPREIDVSLCVLRPDTGASG